MIDILTVTLNPAIDIATSVDQVIAGPKLHCAPPRIDPGGGGVNAARAIKKLGGASTALVAVGGETGDQLLTLLKAEQVDTLPVRVSARTRQNFAVTDNATDAQYRFGLPGQPLSQSDAAHVLDGIADATPKNGFVVLSGSIAPGLPVDFPSTIQNRIADRTDRLVVDTSGPALLHLLAHPAAPVYLLRIDQNEARGAAGHSLKTVQSSMDFAASLVHRGVAKIIVTGRGNVGSIMVTKDQCVFCQAPKVPVLSKIGAGDALVGALTLSLSRGDPLEQALRWGVASASATVKTKGTALCDLEDVERLLPLCVTRQM
jgi:6-phosphofructokinase 2